jgi:prevent-host-death family protein
MEDGHPKSYLVHMARYSVAEAKNNLPKLLDLTLKGEEVTITRRGEPIVDLSPHKVRTGKLDIEWIKQHRVVPASGSNFDSAAMIRKMRDEGY